MKKHLLFCMAMATAVVSMAQTISEVSPNTATVGTTDLTVTFTLSGSSLPPSTETPTSVMIGSLEGSSIVRASSTNVTAVFDFTSADEIGIWAASIDFTDPLGNDVAMSMTDGFTVTVGAETAPVITAEPSSASVYLESEAVLSVAAYGSDPMSYQWQKDLLDVGSGTNTAYTIDAASADDAGDYRCIIVNDYGSVTSAVATLTVSASAYPSADGFVMVDTMQTNCYSDSAAITAPEPGEAFAGQDAQYAGVQASYTVSGDGLTVYDNNTGLTWTQSPDTDGDGEIETEDKLSYAALFERADAMNDAVYGGFSDWRVPSIKEMYSLMDFRGMDPSGYESADTSGLIPFIDNETFGFAYGDTNNDERIIDAQYGSTALYVDGEDKLFGVNFADGRIKGYDLEFYGSDKTFSAMFCRGNEDFGINDFELISTNVVVDHATGLMWQQSDSLVGLNWEEALAYAEGLELDGYCDWRLPTAKELQGIVDYSRSPGTTDSAAIDPIFSCTEITNENNEADYPWYWSGTTHENWEDAEWAAYVAFGRAMGYDADEGWTDVHGAGCQRSDPKSGVLSENTTDFAYEASSDGIGGGYYQLDAPQGDAARVYNFVRCVRGGADSSETDSDGDGLTDWYEYNYSSSTTAMDADADDDNDGVSNEDECTAGTIPTDADSIFMVTTLSDSNLTWSSELDRTYTLEYTTNLTNGFTSLESGISATVPTNTYLLDGDDGPIFYRVLVE